MRHAALDEFLKRAVSSSRHYDKAFRQLKCHHHQLHQFHKFKPFSSLNTQTETNPPSEIECQYKKSIDYHRLSDFLRYCLDTNDLRLGSSVLTHLIKFEPNGFISIWNKVLGLYCKCRLFQKSHQLFDKMPQRDTVSFNTIISASVRGNRGIDQALEFYTKMKEECITPNHITLSSLVGACAGLLNTSYIVEQIHAQAIRYGFSSNEFVGSSLVDNYAKQMRLDDAVGAFDEILELDLVSWNIMIDGCARCNSKQQALRIFSRLRSEGVGFDSFTLASITKTCSESRDLSTGMQIHGCVVKAGFGSETPTSNALITMYSRCEEEMVSGPKIFESILEPNIISWTAIIAGYMQNGQSEDALRFYQRMLRVGMKENEFSFASILPIYSSLASLEQGTQVHARIIKTPFGADVSVANALIDMYSKCGNLADAKMVFTGMEKRDVVSWTVMITGFGKHGMGKEALEILQIMTTEGYSPDSVTFLGGLSACSHGGLIDEGLQIFRSMVEIHGVKPRKEHYACVVDMLGRAGRLKDAETFIEEMGIGSDIVVWEALLGACRIHGEMKLGERSARKMTELGSKRNQPYVLLANIYADSGMWEDKGKVRESFGASGLKKEAGRSWVAVQGTF